MANLAPDSVSADVTTALARIEQRQEELLQQVKTMSGQLAQVTRREAELRLVLKRNLDLDPHVERLLRRLDKPATRVATAAAIDGAELHVEPFPYIIVDNLLPHQHYSALLRGIPPALLFRSKTPGKEQLAVPFALAPSYAHRVWGHLASELIPKVIAPRIVEKFRLQIDEWISLNWPGLDPRSVTLHGSGGRIMLRRRGYCILPHRDPKWSFLTCILYMARPGDSETWGTQLYAVDGDKEARSAAPYWIDEKKCRLVEDAKFLPNRLLVFLNSVGAHGAHIPPDAQPEDLERYMFQFRVGPDLETIKMMKSRLSEDRQPFWAGKALVDY